MSDPLHVLVYGPIDGGVTDTLRVGQFVAPLAGHGVEVRGWESLAHDLVSAGTSGAPASSGRDPAASDALRDAGLTALAWADVLLFRRWRSTHPICTECEARFERHAELAGHVAASRHRTIVPDVLLRPLVALLESHPELFGRRAIVYDTDDDVLDYPAWTGFGPAAARERDLVVRLLRLADLVTAATPVLAGRLAAVTSSPVLVVRNALDPAWYAAPPDPELPGSPRVVYHGVPVRLRDYELARPAVDRLAAELPGLRRVWLGAAHEPRVEACMDEVRPWTEGPAAFAAALARARPDVGLAPLLDEPFNRAKSELHWLEYALAGAPAVVSGFEGSGPFDVVRDGIDALVAATADDWYRHLRTLATSAELRVEIAGRARERVLAEYTVERRAAEWAAAYRWAAEHAGLGRLAASRSDGPETV